MFIHNKCNRCSYEWAQKNRKVPISCARCRSPYWNKKRRNKATGRKTFGVKIREEE